MNNKYLSDGFMGTLSSYLLTAAVFIAIVGSVYMAQP